MTAYQLHYTSSASGLHGYPGFQFVALSAGTPAVAEHAVSRYLTYQPPPSAPAQPAPAEMAGFPLAFGYSLEQGNPVLTLCRYCGRDYSGRFGNFFGHAVFAEPSDLYGLRPIEFWNASWWSGTAAEPPAARDLPTLSRLAAGDAVDPTEVQVMLANGGYRAYLLLERLVDAVLQVMDKAHGRVILLADDVNVVAMWIAAVSYSLPYSMTRDLSFVTYSANPEQAPYRLIGTTYDVADRGLRCSRFDLDRLQDEADDATASVYARSLVDSWRSGNLMRIDAICDLADLGSGQAGDIRVDAWSTAAAFRDSASLLALSVDGEPLSERDVPAVAQLIRHCAVGLPSWLWAAFRDGTVPNFGLRLAAWRAAAELLLTDVADPVGVSCVMAAIEQPAYRARIPDGVPLSAAAREQLRPRIEERLTISADLRDIAELAEMATLTRISLDNETLRHATSSCVETHVADINAVVPVLPEAYKAIFRLGLLEGLEAAPKDIREATLDAAACEWLGRGDWRSYPRVGRRVLMQRGAAHPGERLVVADQLLALCRHVRTTGEEIRGMLEELWQGQSPSHGDRQQLLASAGRMPDLALDMRCEVASFAWPQSDQRPVKDERGYRLARDVWFLLDQEESIRLAANAGLLVALYELTLPGLAGGSVQSIGHLSHKADPELAADVTDRAVQTIANLTPRVQAEILSSLSDTTGGVSARARDLLLNRPCHDVPDLARLAELALWLHRLGAPDAALEEHLVRILADQGGALRAELHRYDARTAAALDRLLRPATGETSGGTASPFSFIRRMLKPTQAREGPPFPEADGNDRS